MNKNEVTEPLTIREDKFLYAALRALKEANKGKTSGEHTTKVKITTDGDLKELDAAGVEHLLRNAEINTTDQRIAIFDGISIGGGGYEIEFNPTFADLFFSGPLREI